MGVPDHKGRPSKEITMTDKKIQTDRLDEVLVVIGRSKGENEKVKKALIRSIINGHPELNPSDAELRKLQKRQARAAK
jgi:hypothetical protein